MRAALEVAELGRRDGVPVVATHSNAYHLTPNSRNLTDEVAVAIARTGGVIGVAFHSRFLRVQGRASITDVVRHIRYLIALVGIEHVGIGSDFEGGIVPARGLENVSKLDALVDALRGAGLTAEAVEAVLSGNALRLLERETFSCATDNGKKEASEEASVNAFRVP
jgi:membrane dipeptidase